MYHAILLYRVAGWVHVLTYKCMELCAQRSVDCSSTIYTYIPDISMAMGLFLRKCEVTQSGVAYTMYTYIYMCTCVSGCIHSVQLGYIRVHDDVLY